MRLLALFTDAIYLPVRPEGPKEGVLVAWGYTTDGTRVLLDVCLGQRERTEDWLDLGRGLIRRGRRSPLLVVSDGAPGLVAAITELWPDADRQRCSVHRLRNILAKLPERPGLQRTASAALPTIRCGGRRPGDASRSGRSRPTSPSTAGPAPAGITSRTRSDPANSRPTTRSHSSSGASRCRHGPVCSARAATHGRD